jgi:photosystem II stability/assembly factor-like uncharacterized protein
MRRLFAATGDAVARIDESGSEWCVSLSLGGSAAQCLAVDPREEGTLYAGTRGQGVWKSTDQGENWENLGLPQPDVFSVAVSPADGAVYAGCEPSMLFRSEDGGLNWREMEALRRLPSAPTWSFPPRPWTSHVRWIAPSPHDAGLLLVGIELGGLMLSRDGGESWLDHRPGAQRDVHALAWHPRVPGRAYEAGGGGAAWSRDGGETWQPADAGRDRHYTWALAVDPADPDCWFVSASPGPRQAHSGGDAQACLYRWRGDGPWQAVDGGLPGPLEAMPYALTVGPDALYVGLSDGGISTSRDGGETWQSLVLRGDPLPSIRALVDGDEKTVLERRSSGGGRGAALYGVTRDATISRGAMEAPSAERGESMSADIHLACFNNEVLNAYSRREDCLLRWAGTSGWLETPRWTLRFRVGPGNTLQLPERELWKLAPTETAHWDSFRLSDWPIARSAAAAEDLPADEDPPQA